MSVRDDESQREDLTEFELSHDYNPDQEELKQEVIGEKRLADQPSEELEAQIKGLPS